MSYYDRAGTTHIDGTPVFATAEDRRAERRVAGLLGAAWGCEIQPFGPLSPVDWYATKDGRLAGVLELKARSHTPDTYPTVFLNVRKWLALSLAAAGLGVPAVFVVSFSDGSVRWVPILEINAQLVTIGGCSRRVKADSDIEPVIEVPVDQLREVRGADGV